MPLSITNTAVDTDIPANTLTYNLLQGPPGATISPSGVISWTPGEVGQGPGSYTFTTVVTDNGIPSLSTTNSFAVTCLGGEHGPRLVQPQPTRRCRN